MRIVQLTDLHIGLAGENTFDIDVRGNFLKICRRVKQWAPDYVVVSGDLCYQYPDPVIYEWIKQQLEGLEITYDLLSGNHDDPEMMARIFGREHLLVDGGLYFQRQLEGYPYLFLDTTTGLIPAQQLKWLAATLQEQSGQLIIFMHHPPLLAGVPHMDNNYALQNREEVFQLLLDYADPVDVFCGHYHVDKTIRVDQVNVHITPSTYFQIDQFSESFAVDHRRPGIRAIELTENYLSHTVIFL